MDESKLTPLGISFLTKNTNGEYRIIYNKGTVGVKCFYDANSNCINDTSVYEKNWNIDKLIENSDKWEAHQKQVDKQYMEEFTETLFDDNQESQETQEITVKEVLLELKKVLSKIN